jgi:WD40 repeat-containing protein SMU1
MWNVKTTECIKTIKPDVGSGAVDLTINSIHLFPKNVDQFVMCNRSSTVAIMNMQGQVNHCITLTTKT